MGERAFDTQSFAAYIAAFNEDNFDAYGRYYAPGIRMNYNGRVALEGHDAIREFYARTHGKLQQTIRILGAVATPEVLFADIEGTFVAKEDYPDFSVGPLRKGESILSRSLARYDLEKGLIASVTTARYALEQPAQR